MTECAYCRNEIEGAGSVVVMEDGSTAVWCEECAAKVDTCDKCGHTHPADRLDLVCVDEGGRDEPPSYEAWCPGCIADATYGEEDEDDYDYDDEGRDDDWFDEAL